MCDKFFAKHGAYFTTVARVLFGALFLCHGLMKFGMFGSGFAPMYSIYWFAGVIEIVAGGLVVVGLLTRYAAILAAADMVGAWFIAHAPQGWNPFSNGGELALLYLAAFLFIMTMGGGMWSLDKKFGFK
jgi:putative oxidoreductase